MKANMTTAAPEAENMIELYEEWQKSHVGSFNEFTEFMTTPGVEREIFLSAIKHRDIRFTGNVVENVIL